MHCRRRGRVRWFEQLEDRRVLNVGDPYVVPPNPRVVQNLDPGWKFQLNPTGTPQSTAYNDSSWSSIDLPYTWDGSTTNAPLGIGWYRKTITVDPSLSARNCIWNSAARIWSRVCISTERRSITIPQHDRHLDSHNGGFGEFDFDVTSQLTARQPSHCDFGQQ